MNYRPFRIHPGTQVAQVAQRELKSLTSLRGIAAMAVVMTHFSATAQRYCRITIPALVPHGYMAVDFFFILSGFIMSYSYLEEFRSAGLGAYLPFLGKRLARVWPLNAAVLTILVVLGGVSFAISGHRLLLTSQRLWFDYPANLLMVQGIGIGTNLNGPSWSISTEFAAYLIFPTLLGMVFGSRRRAWVAAIVATAGLCWLALQQRRLGLGFDGPPASLLRCVTEFSLGMIAYRLFLVPAVRRFLGQDVVALVLSGVSVGWLALGYDLPAALLRAAASGPLGGPEALAWAFVASCSVIPFAWLSYRFIERPGRDYVRRALAGAGRYRLAPPLVGATAQAPCPPSSDSTEAAATPR